MSDYLSAYEEYLKTEKQASENTVSSYLRDVHQFAQAMEELGIPLAEAETKDVEEYSRSLTRKGRSPATVTRSVAAIKSFYNCMIALGRMERNPAKGVTPAKVERKLPQVLTGKEVELFLEQPECTDLKGYRDRAMLELLYATGIRVSELIALDVDDLNLPAGILKCYSKGKERIIPLYPAAVRALTEYIHNIRPQLVESLDETALFVNMNGERMSRQGFCRPSAGKRGRPALHSGDAGPRRYLLHPNLLQAAQPEDQGRILKGPPQGVKRLRSKPRSRFCLLMPLRKRWRQA